MTSRRRRLKPAMASILAACLVLTIDVCLDHIGTTCDIEQKGHQGAS